jgi:hypothetical protein
MSIKNTVTRSLAKSKLKVKNNSPHILFVAGLGGVIAGTVLACRATLKVEPMLDEMKEDIQAVKAAQDGESVNQQDLAYAYGVNAARLARSYAPAIIVGGLGIAALTGSHVQLSRRNTALTIAYAGLHQAYLDYRERVRAELGEEREKELYFDLTPCEIEDENGKLKQVMSVDPNKLSVYARIFDESNPNWHKNAEYNRLFIQCQQNYANNLLQARGSLFLNEVYDMLGIDRSSAGQFVGWFLNSDGDNFVDFGLFETYSARFVNGYERSIILDFNVDGVIVNKI